MPEQVLYDSSHRHYHSAKRVAPRLEGKFDCTNEILKTTGESYKLQLLLAGSQ